MNCLLRKCKEQYQRKTPEQLERIRQEARKVYYLRKLGSTYESEITLEQWSEGRRLAAAECDRMREQRRVSRQSKMEIKIIVSRTRLPRALMDPQKLKLAHQKARKAQRRKRAGLIDEEKKLSTEKEGSACVSKEPQ